MVDLLEGVEKIKESEKIMTQKDFKETGEKVRKYQINSKKTLFLGNKQIPQ